MFISKFTRIDTMSWPGMFLSVVDVMPGEGDGENMDIVANVLRDDRDSIDGVMFRCEGEDPENMEGFHNLIRHVRPRGIESILITSGNNPDALDDLVGAGYVTMVSFRLEDKPNPDQLSSIAKVAYAGIRFTVAMVLDPKTVTAEDVVFTADVTPGHSEFVLLMPRDPAPHFKRKDLNALIKSLKGRARNVRVLDYVRTTTGPVQQRD